MVHALEHIRSLLKPGGVLIDIHPNGQPPPVVVRCGDVVQTVGTIHEDDDFVEYEQANAALNDVLGRGLYTCERAEEFAFVTHTASIDELRGYLAEEWKDAILDNEIDRNARRLTSACAEANEVQLRETVGIMRLRSTRSTSFRAR
jgi:hypothetical protein